MHHDGGGKDISRRGLIAAGGGAMVGAALASRPAEAAARGPHPRTPDAALKLLMQGNRRYRAGKLELRDYSPVGDERASKQKPFAAILGCADSRVSPSLVFDITSGNLFQSRVAGNTVDTGTLGSTEYAVAVLGVKLVMVLGHSDCGAVKAALGVADGSSSYPPERFGAIGAIVDAIVPAINALAPERRTLHNAIDANALAEAEKLAASDPIVKPAVEAGRLKVVAARYDIGSGRVSLLSR